MSISGGLIRRIGGAKAPTQKRVISLGPAQARTFMSLTDLRYALRSLSHARGFTLAVVLTLGLGIGANTAIFSVVRGVLLKPLPHRNGERLVSLRQSISGPGGEDI